jgi:hypothetical protein
MLKQMVWSLAAVFVLTGTSQALLKDEATAPAKQSAAPTAVHDKENGNPHHGHHDSARRHGKHMKMKAGMGFAHPVLANAEELDLSAAQVSAIRQLQSQHREERRPLMRQMKRGMIDFQLAVMDPASNRDTLREKVREHVAVIEAMADNFWAERQAVIQVLTAEQRERLRQMEFDLEGHPAEDDEED